MHQVSNCMRRTFNMRSKGFVIGIRVLVFYLNANAIWLMNSQLLNYIENPMDSYIFKFVFNVTAIFSFMSYCTAAFKQRKPVP